MKSKAGNRAIIHKATVKAKIEEKSVGAVEAKIKVKLNMNQILLLLILKN